VSGNPFNGGPNSVRLAFKVYDLFVSYFFALLMLTSGIMHWKNPYALFSSIQSYSLIGVGGSWSLAVAIPAIQLVVGIGLIIRKLLDPMHMVCTILFSLFLIAQLHAFSSHLDINCGCFGPSGDDVIDLRSVASIFALWLASVVRNTIKYLFTEPPNGFQLLGSTVGPKPD
jgi:hypothetical protein